MKLNIDIIRNIFALFVGALWVRLELSPNKFFESVLSVAMVGLGAIIIMELILINLPRKQITTKKND